VSGHFIQLRQNFGVRPDRFQLVFPQSTQLFLSQPAEASVRIRILYSPGGRVV
jgi:hypothetical protein